ncbi:hypothetical protein KY366_07265, partial [Candidatus Woesearchaeota archaeon]|nr:hypothetical protein [Candidatus Woesearchaeota archaeon]
MQTTPTSINNDVLEFCKEIDPTTNPVFVEVAPPKETLYNECYGNVEEQVKKKGGKIEYGWIIWENPKIYLEAEFHAVWINNEGEYIDITPKKDKEKSILFLKDSKRKFTGSLIDNIRKPLVDNAETRTMLLVEKRKFEIHNKYHDGNPNTEIPMFEIQKLEDFKNKTYLSEIKKDMENGKIG